jgi:hypothetical protein
MQLYYHAEEEMKPGQNPGKISYLAEYAPFPVQ